MEDDSYKIEIDKESGVPVYYQIKEYLTDLVANRQLNTGDKILSERELASKCGVSRMTARKAIDDLVKEGYFNREIGRGTFVSPPKMDHLMLSPVSFSEDMLRRGLRAGGTTLNKVITHSKTAASLLLLDNEAPVLMMERLRFADNIPVVFERSWYDGNRYAFLMDEDLENHSLYKILDTKMGVTPSFSRESIEAVLADAHTAKLLKINERLPILKVTALSRDGDLTPVEYTESYYRGDKYRFVVDLERNS